MDEKHHHKNYLISHLFSRKSAVCLLQRRRFATKETKETKEQTILKERERERVLSRSGCESERAFSFFLESLGVLSCAFFLFQTDLRSGFD